MAEEETKFPFPCDCCEVAVILKDKQRKYYHLKKSNRAKSLRGEMPLVKVKRAREDFENEGEAFLLTNFNLFKKSVLKSNFLTTGMEANVVLLEDDLEPDTKAQVREVCQKKLEEWENRVSLIREHTTTHYDASSQVERDFLRSLSVKIPQGANEGGVLIYEKSEEVLKWLLADTKARVEAIEYELVRREFEPEKIVYEFFVERYASRRREGYTQEV